MDLLRITTAGHVDDGKSTLIGRLLYDSKAILDDQYDALVHASRARGRSQVDLALLTDGLRDERDQGITIDVAYRYFSTPRRKFIIADTPGHEQYTRNMVTGASTADLAIILVDAQRGLSSQSRRHSFIASLLQLPHVIVAINKMDLVGYRQDAFQSIEEAFRQFAAQLDLDNLLFVPISALHGDNVVDQSTRMPWYNGGTLLHYLETVKAGARRNVIDFRFPVQHVIRPHQDFRGFAGEVVSGSISVGEDITVLPSRKTSRVKGLHAFEAQPTTAGPGASVVLTLEDDIDISRGDTIVRSRNLPVLSTHLDAMVCWMDEAPLNPSKRYLIQHGPRQAQVAIDTLVYRIDVDTLHRQSVETLSLNEIGRVELATSTALAFDPYKLNRHTGCFILIDPDTNHTVATGLIRGEAQGVAPVGGDEGRGVTPEKSPNVVWEGLNIERARREARNGHRAAVVWFTGLSGSGKTTIARDVEERLFERGTHTMLLDGDYIRHGLSSDLAFTPQDRTENIRRVGEVARLFFEQGCLTLCSFISPYADNRAAIADLFPDGRFFDIHVDADLDTLIERDTKGLYAKAQAGEIDNFTGISAPYEAPEHPALRLDTTTQDQAACVRAVLRLLEDEGIIETA